MQNEETTIEDRVAGLPEPVDASRMIVIDPSDAVTGTGFVLGLVGALVGIAIAVYLTPSFNLALVSYCLVAAFAGGSAGVVTGGLIGAVFAVMRGVIAPPTGRG